jgi:hypothetical protein
VWGPRGRVAARGLRREGVREKGCEVVWGLGSGGLVPQFGEYGVGLGGRTPGIGEYARKFSLIAMLAGQR